MSGVTCPACSKALPGSVLTGPAQAVVRCEGCSTLLLWSHGKVVRSARSNPQTLQGVPVVKPPPAAAAPVAAKPTAKTLMGMPTVPAKAADEEQLDEKDFFQAKPPPVPKKPGAPATAPAKGEPPLSALKPDEEAPPRPTQTLGKISPVRRDPLRPNKPEPMPEAKPAAKSPEPKSQIATAVPQKPVAMPGPMEDPSEWFDDTQVHEPGDDEPTSVGPAPVSSKSEPALAPLEPIETRVGAKSESKPAAGRSLFAMSTERDLPPLGAQKTTMAMAPEPPAKPEPQKTLQLDPPAQPEPQKTLQLEPPAKPARAEPKAKPESKPKYEPRPERKPEPKLEAKPEPKFEAKPEPLPAPPRVTRDPSPLPMPAPAQKAPAMAAMDPLSLAPDRRRSPLLLPVIATAVGAVLVVTIVILARSGPAKDSSPPVAITAPKPPPPAPAPPPPPAPVPVPPPPTVAMVEPRPPAREEKEEALAPPTAPTDEEGTPRRRRGGAKKVVLEYDTPHKEEPETKSDDPAKIEQARAAYKKGNERLFTGNSAGAVAAYKESLAIYPGYVAGYRGLGLAYAQEGNTDEALSALRTYVKTVPSAHDVPIIKKRIEHLEKSTQP